MLQKQCSKCKQIKTVIEFSPDHRRSDKLQSQCKACRKDAETSRRLIDEAYRTKQNDARRNRYRENREIELLNKQRAYASPDKKAAIKQYRETPERKERHREWMKQWRIENHDKACQIGRRHYKKHVQQYLEHNRKRKVRILGVNCTLTQQEWEAIKIKYGNKCLACGTTENISMDHIVPIALGGTHSADNVQPLCRSCNSKKHLNVVDYRIPLVAPIERSVPNEMPALQKEYGNQEKHKTDSRIAGIV